MQVGDKVRYTGSSPEQVAWGANANPERDGVYVGAEGIVERAEVHSWHTKIWVRFSNGGDDALLGPYNSVSFVSLVDGPEYWLTMTYACSGRMGRSAWPGNPNPPPGYEMWKDPRPAEPAYLSCGYEMKFWLEVGCEGPPDHPRRVPVPFVAGTCPNCGKGDLTHVRWNKDEVLAPRIVGPLEVPHFAYPLPAEFEKYGDQACGRPVYSRFPGLVV